MTNNHKQENKTVSAKKKSSSLANSQNQSQENLISKAVKSKSRVATVNSLGSSPDTLRGIFSTEDLEKKSDETNNREIFMMIQSQIRERQRLKSEVEKVIDKEIEINNSAIRNYEMEGIPKEKLDLVVHSLEELKKRLGI